MMKILTVFTLIFLYSCGNVPKSPSPVITNETIEITSFKAGCEGTAQNLCLQVRGEGQKNWAAFNNVIKDFSYEEGYTFTLKVQKVNLDTSKIPGDMNSVGYTLIKMIQKQYNPMIRLHDIWVVKSLNKESIKKVQITLDLQLSKRKIYGNDSCNEFFGDISHVTENDISFELLGRTKKMCPDMTYANSFYDTMKEIKGYRVEGLFLYLLNGNDEELIKLLKVD